MLENISDITIDQVLGTAQKMYFEKYRFITITCVEVGANTVDLIYQFDRDLTLKQFRLRVGKDEEVPSISQIFFCALLVENEIKELFGVTVTDIVIDYGGHLLLSDGAPSTPMACGGQITIEQKS